MNGFGKTPMERLMQPMGLESWAEIISFNGFGMGTEIHARAEYNDLKAQSIIQRTRRSSNFEIFKHLNPLQKCHLWEP
jgi:hypothetical protein